MNVTINTLQKWKKENQKFACLTCYDATFAQVCDEAEIDVLLIGDSLGMVINGESSTIPVSVDDICYHTRAVAKKSSRALIMADMPFMAARTIHDGLSSAMKLMQAGCHIIKLEGGRALIPLVQILKEQGVPVCVHLGLTPQAVHALSGYKTQAKDDNSAENLINTAIDLEEAGADIILVECIPPKVTQKLYEAIQIPLIGIGAGPHCDGQILVVYDMLGIPDNRKARFVKNYMQDSSGIKNAFQKYKSEVLNGKYPAKEHTF